MSSLEELRVNYRLVMDNLIKKYNGSEFGSEDSNKLLSEIERLDVLIKDVEDKIEKRDAAFRKELLDESLRNDKRIEIEKAAQRESDEKKADRKCNIIVASITGGCGLLGGLLRLNRQNNLINTVLDFSKDSEVTGCSKQSLFRSLLGDFFKM